METSRRRFMAIAGLTVFGVFALRIAKKSLGVVWQGSNDVLFRWSESVDYVAMVGNRAVFTAKPTHPFLKFGCGDPTKEVGFDIGSKMYDIVMTENDTLDLHGFDWDKYKKRIGNTYG